MINEAFGTASLVVEGRKTLARIVLDANKNQFGVTIQNGEDVSFDSIVSLVDVELFGDGIKWSTPKIDNLMVVNYKSRGLGAGENLIGEITGQNQYRTKLTLVKNGQHSFDLDSEFEHSFEFSGGLSTYLEIELSDGVHFYSDGKRSSLRGKNCSDASDELSALSLACGCVMRPRYELNGKLISMVFWQSLSESKAVPLFDTAKDGRTNIDKTTAGIKEVYQKTKQYLDVTPQGAEAPVRELISWFLHCRQRTSVLDLQMLNLFAFLEAVDGSRTLNGNTLGPLLGVDIELAKELVCVRNGYSHGRHGLSVTIDNHVDMARSEFQNVAVQGGAAKEATFMNFLHKRCNRVFLDFIGSNLEAERPYPTS